MSVSIKPGQMALRVTPFLASSRHTVLVRPTTPAWRRHNWLSDIPQPAGGGDVDDGAASLFPHNLGSILDAVKNVPVRLTRNDLIPLLHSHLVQHGVAVDSGVVDNNIQCAEDSTVKSIIAFTSSCLAILTGKGLGLPPEALISSAVAEGCFH